VFELGQGAESSRRRELQDFALRLLQALGGGAARPRVAPRLLKVGEVADRLGVSTATEDALCRRGAQHVRVANAPNNC